MEAIDRANAGDKSGFSSAAWAADICIGVGIGDVIDTFSHLHTPLEISVLRIVNGLVAGAIVGALLIWIYRRSLYRRSPS